MAIHCCGKTRMGKFCSECGQALAPDDIHGLLGHVRHHAEKLRKHADAAYEYWRQSGNQNDLAKKGRIETCRGAAEKWEKWYAALKNLIEKAEGETPCAKAKRAEHTLYVLLGYLSTCKQSNTDAWMHGLADRMNKAAGIVNYHSRFVYRDGIIVDSRGD
jgi:hypothetical protein